MSLFSFRKEEIIRKKKQIDRLFDEGRAFFIHPFKVIYLPYPAEPDSPAQILISVSKRSFKNATDRNRIKRQIREVYRLNKHEFYHYLNEKQTGCLLAVIYSGQVMHETHFLEKKIKAVINRLINELSKNLNNPSISLSDQ
ncbi:MAG TPA: ribonuclease P protein component [Bacteroidales bacterium]|nr:ribonuclease P protein component [Bacteroidales bacterium]HOX78667.1 ribonuclease P protein component [Bacteroidales bacterium]HPI85484.1 ribonuclease P protein component [Bacteroidales bacterium]HPM92548.1 ribonuclease P protein component [Bacteroidales bacterium]